VNQKAAQGIHSVDQKAERFMSNQKQEPRRGKLMLVFALAMFLTFVGAAIVALLISGGSDDDEPVPPATILNDDAGTGMEDDADATAAAPNLDTGLDVSGPSLGGGGSDDNASGAASESGGIGSTLPGCDDLTSDECPIPLDPSVVPLDDEASSGGVTIAYPSRFFEATTSPDGVLITIAPSEQNRFDLKATFEVYFADSIDAALAELADLPGEPDTAAWSTDTLSGTIGVVNDDTQDPFTTTAIGAFNLGDSSDDRVIVLKATTTGQFGWYFHTKLYEAMLNSLAVEAA
jgi:hypothetical protein